MCAYENLLFDSRLMAVLLILKRADSILNSKGRISSLDEAAYGGMLLVLIRNLQVIALAAAIDGGFASIAPDLQCFGFRLAHGRTLTANARIKACRCV